MHAAVFHAPNNITNEEIHYDYNDESLGTVSLRVQACAVCGYDTRVFRIGHQKVTPPIILGHEICGVLEKDVLLTKTVDYGMITQTLIKAGSRVAVSPIIPCLNCKYCYNNQYNLCVNLKEIGSSIDGGFAEYVRIPEKILKIGGLVSVPANLSDEEAALLEPLACSLNCFSQIGPITPEETVAIIGDGPLGLLHAQISKRLFGAKTIVIGKIPHRMEKAKLMGADTTTAIYHDNNDQFYSDKEALKDTLNFTDGLGANVIIVATSNPYAIGFAQKIASRNSRIDIFAGTDKGISVSLDPNWLHYNQITITGSFSSVPNMLERAAKLASNGDINLSKLITHKYSLGNIKEAILATEEYRGLRVVIDSFR